MRKRVALNLFLLLCVAVLTAVLLLTAKTNPPASFVRLSDIDRARISTIMIQRPGQKTILFNRQGLDWYMQSPQETAANPMRINAMLNLLQVESRGRLELIGQDLAPFKLDAPEVTLLLDHYLFSFGTDNPLDQSRYVLFDNAIHLIDDYLFHQLTQPAEFFIQQAPAAP